MAISWPWFPCYLPACLQYNCQYMQEVRPGIKLKKLKFKKLTVFMLFIGPVQKLRLLCIPLSLDLNIIEALQDQLNRESSVLFSAHSKGSQHLKKRFKNPEELFPKATQGKTPRESSGYLEELRCS